MNYRYSSHHHNHPFVQQNGEEKNKIEKNGGILSPLWGVCFNPQKDDGEELLVSIDWSQTLTFFDVTGKQVAKLAKPAYLD